MNDRPPSRLELLRFARRVAERHLAEIDRWIADEERRETERQRGIAARPPAPDWLLELSLGARHPVQVHVGGCHMAGKRPRGIGRQEALRRLADGVPACGHCRPDSALGFLE
ncbi:DUF6233 domain-containing protein [Streptomyces sp. NPDC013178]|uniref:DUF6233 domain-containing protein n=1 Tax=Streptomyces sp. NPDC013178 TaxID=3155118 RepID=UPI0033FCA09D